MVPAADSWARRALTVCRMSLSSLSTRGRSRVHQQERRRSCSARADRLGVLASMLFMMRMMSRSGSAGPVVTPSFVQSEDELAQLRAEVEELRVAEGSSALLLRRLRISGDQPLRSAPGQRALSASKPRPGTSAQRSLAPMRCYYSARRACNVVLACRFARWSRKTAGNTEHSPLPVRQTGRYHQEFSPTLDLEVDSNRYAGFVSQVVGRAPAVRAGPVLSVGAPSSEAHRGPPWLLR